MEDNIVEKEGGLHHWADMMKRSHHRRNRLTALDQPVGNRRLRDLCDVDQGVEQSECGGGREC